MADQADRDTAHPHGQMLTESRMRASDASRLATVLVLQDNGPRTAHPGRGGRADGGRLRRGDSGSDRPGDRLAGRGRVVGFWLLSPG